MNDRVLPNEHCSTARTTRRTRSSRSSATRCASSASGRRTCRPRRAAPAPGFLDYAYLNEQIGLTVWGQLVFGCQAPDAGNAEILHLFGTDEQKERWLFPLVAGRDPLVLLDDRARGARLRPDDAAHARGARRRRLGDRRPQVVLVGRRGRGVRDRHGRHRSRRGAARASDPDHRPGRHARRRRRPAGARDGARRPRLVDALRGALHGRPRAGDEHARRRRRRLPDRPEAARARAASTT